MFARERLPGFWIFGSVVDPEEFEGIDRDKALAIDGSGGGSYALTAPLVLGGSGVDLLGNNHVVSGKLTVQSLALISLADGAEIKAEGTGDADIRLRVVSSVARLEVGSGAVVQVKSGGALDVHGSLTLKNASGPGSITAEDGTTITMLDGSTLTAASGSTVNLNGATSIGGTATVPDGGTVAFGNGSTLTGAAVTLDPAAVLDWDGIAKFADLRLDNGNWPVLSPSQNWERHTLLLAFCTFNNHGGTGPDDPDAWAAPSDLSDSQCVRTRAAGNSGDYSVIEFKHLPPGATLASCKVKSKGNGATDPVYPTYQIVRWVEGDDFEEVSSPAVDIHDSDGNWNTLSRTTTITPSTSHTIASAYRYGVRVTHPYPASAVGTDYMRIYSVSAYGTLASLRNN